MSFAKITSAEFLSVTTDKTLLEEGEAIAALLANEGIKFPCRWTHRKNGTCPGGAAAAKIGRRRGFKLRYAHKSGVLYVCRVEAEATLGAKSSCSSPTDRITAKEFGNVISSLEPRLEEDEAVAALAPGEGIRFPCHWTHDHNNRCRGVTLAHQLGKRLHFKIQTKHRIGMIYVFRRELDHVKINAKVALEAVLKDDPSGLGIVDLGREV